MSGKTSTSSINLQYRQLVSPSVNESLKANIYSVTKLTKTVSEFCSKLASIKEQSAHQLSALVETFRKKTNDIKKRPECQSHTFFDAWDKILIEVENEAKDLSELSQTIHKTVAAPLFHSASRKKSYCKKVFSYREACQQQIYKAEDDLIKKHKDYSDAWYKYRSQAKDHHVAVYHNCHNSYILQLANVNSINETFYVTTVPELLDDLEQVHEDIASILVRYLKRYITIRKESLSKISSRLDNVVNAAETFNVREDIDSFVKYVGQDLKDRKPPYKDFTPPKVTKELKEDSGAKDTAYLTHSLVVDENTEPALKRKCAYIKKMLNRLDTMMKETKVQIENRDETPNGDSTTISRKDSTQQENVVLGKRNELRDQVSQIASLKEQMDLFTPAVLERLGPVTEEFAEDLEQDYALSDSKPRMMSMRSDRERPHHFVEHNFMKPTQCYYCKGIIVGLLKQGCRCQQCKMSVHKKCKGNVPFCSGAVIHKTSATNQDEDGDGDGADYEQIESDSDLDRRRRKSGCSLNTDSDYEHDYEAPLDAKPQQSLLKSSPLAVPSNRVGFQQNQPLPDTPKSSPVPEWCVALYDFTGVEACDLHFDAGTRIEVINKSSDDWWEGKCCGKQGYFPSSYVEEIEENSIVLKCLYDFTAQPDEDEMSITQGQIIVQVEDEGNGWTVGRCADKSGAFPSSYVEVIK